MQLDSQPHLIVSLRPQVCPRQRARIEIVHLSHCSSTYDDSVRTKAQCTLAEAIDFASRGIMICSSITRPQMWLQAKTLQCAFASSTHHHVLHNRCPVRGQRALPFRGNSADGNTGLHDGLKMRCFAGAQSFKLRDRGAGAGGKESK